MIVHHLIIVRPVAPIHPELPNDLLTPVQRGQHIIERGVVTNHEG